MDHQKRQNPSKDALHYIGAGKDREGFEVRFVDENIGHGVFATKEFMEGSFLLHYEGEELTEEAALARARECEKGNTFMLFFKRNGKIMCIDATHSKFMARMVNDATGKSANCVMKKQKINSGKDVPCLFALRHISPGEELRYDYGQPDLPWRSKGAGVPGNTNTTTGKKKRKLEAFPENIVESSAQMIVNKKGSEQVAEIVKECSVRLIRINIPETPNSNFMEQQDPCEDLEAGDSEEEDMAEEDLSDSNVAQIVKECSVKLIRLNIPERSGSNFVAEQDPCGDQNVDTLENLDEAKEDFSDFNNPCEDLEAGDSEEEDMAEEDLSDSNVAQKVKECSVKLIRLNISERSGSNFVAEQDPCGDQNVDTLENLEEAKEDFPNFSDPCEDLEAGDSEEEYMAEEDLSDSNVAQKVKECSVKLIRLNISERSGSNFVAEQDPCGDQNVDTLENLDEAKEDFSDFNDPCEDLEAGDSKEEDMAEEDLSDSNVAQIVKECSVKLIRLNIPERSGSNYVAEQDPCGDQNVDTLENLDEAKEDFSDFNDPCEDLEAGDSEEEDMAEEDLSDSNVAQIVKECSEVSSNKDPCEDLGDGDFKEEVDHAEEDLSDFNDVDAEMSTPGNGEDSSSESDRELKGAPRKKDNVFVRACKEVKRNCCLFCGKLQTKISKHLLVCHGDEGDVARLAAMSVNSKQRMDGFEILRNKGNFLHNKKVIAAGKGEIIVVRRPNGREKSTNYGPCPTCLGYYLKSDLWKHSHYHCIEQKDLGKERKGSNDIRVESDILQGTFPQASKFLTEVLKYMRNDNVTLVVKNDRLILNMGENIAMKCVGMDVVKRRNYVSQKMRECSRLLMQLRRLCPEKTNLQDFLHPHMYNDVVHAVRGMAGDSNEDLEDLDGFKQPSIALKLGHNLKKLAAIKRVLALKESDPIREKEAKDFIKIVNSDWVNCISAPALHVLRQRKFNKVEKLPKTEDVQEFSSFLKREVEKVVQELGHSFSHSLYKRCQNLVLTQLVTFNKRRPGEVEQLRLNTFTERSDRSQEGVDSLKEILSPLEKKLCDELEVIYIRGKRGRKVPLLVPPNCLTAMELLVKFRSLGVAKGNPYFFGRLAAMTPLRASDSLRLLSEEADLSDPTLIRSTKLRKYMATLTQVLNLGDEQSEWLADHLGHSLKVHKEYYRLPSSVIERSKIAKLLMAVDAGRVANFVGKTMDEIDVDDIPVEVEHDEEDVNTSETSKDHEILGPSTSAVQVEKGAMISRLTNEASTSRQRNWVPWSSADKELLLQQFHHHLQKKTLPGKKECEQVMKKFPNNFKGRKWTNLKDAIRNFNVQGNSKV